MSSLMKHQRTGNILLDNLEQDVVVNFDAPLATGKTMFLMEALKQHGGRAVFVTARQVLIPQFLKEAERIGFDLTAVRTTRIDEIGFQPHVIIFCESLRNRTQRLEHIRSVFPHASYIQL